MDSQNARVRVGDRERLVCKQETQKEEETVGDTAAHRRVTAQWRVPAAGELRVRPGDTAKTKDRQD